MRTFFCHPYDKQRHFTVCLLQCEWVSALTLRNSYVLVTQTSLYLGTG